MVIETNATKKEQIPLDFGTALLNNVIVTKPHNNRRGIMKNRKRGFSLVELLIVLAVIAALIATITPVALNAIKKAKATQVAQNLKTLASSLENLAYVNGFNTNGEIIANDKTSVALVDLGRDIDTNKYIVDYINSDGDVTAVVIYKGADVDEKLVNEQISYATTTAPTTDYSSGKLNAYATGTDYIYYEFDFTAY